MIIHASDLPPISLPTSSVTDYVLEDRGTPDDRAAFIDGSDGSVMSRSSFVGEVERLTAGFIATGLDPGDVVALALPNGPYFAVVFHAAARAGAAVTTINPLYRTEEIRRQIIDSGAVVVVTDDRRWRTMIAATERTPVAAVYAIDEAPGGTFTQLFSNGRHGQIDIETDSAIAALPYSSGTTGLPKGVMLTHASMTANLEQIRATIDLDDDVTLAVLPMFHIYGMQFLMNTMLAHGVPVVTLPRFELAAALSLIEEHRITRFYAVPPIVNLLAHDPLVDEYDVSSLREVLSAAAPLGPELATAASTRLGCAVTQGYGMTELSPTTHLTRTSDVRPGTCGVAVPHTECRVVDPETGGDHGVGGVGELWIRGPQVMRGYLDNPSATADIIDDDGWLHTGDLASIDDAGHLTIVDRLKELIKSSGFQVAPAELEARLVEHPDVGNAAVIGQPHEARGEAPHAFIVMRDNAVASLDDVISATNEGLASYKHIASAERIDSIPTSPSGKILRRELRRRP